MAGSVASLMVRAGFDGSQLSRGLNQMQGELRGAHSTMRSTMGKVGTLVAGAVVTAGASLVAMGGYISKVGVQYDMMQENSQIAWTTLLGSTQKAKQMLQDIANFAKNTQFDSEGVNMMATYLYNAGYAGKELFDRLTEVADISGAFNIPADSAKELTRQMSQVVQAGVAYTEDLNILADRGVPIYKAISEQLGITVGDVKMMASKGKLTSDIYVAAFDKIAKSVKGASAAQSQTMSGMLSTLKDDFSIVAGVLAKPMFEKLHDGLKQLMPLMDGLTAFARGDLKSFKQSLDSTFGKSGADKITAFVLGTGNILAGFRKVLSNVGQSVVDFYKKAKDSLGGPLSNIFNTLKDIGGSAFKDLAKFALNAIAQIRDFWRKDGDKIMAAVKQAIKDVAAALDASKPVLKAVFDIITTVGIKAFNNFVGAIKWVSNNLNWLIPIAAGVVSGIAAFKVITGVIKLIEGFTLVTQLLNKAWILLDIALDANPIGLIALAIGGLITAGVLLYRNWDTVKNKMSVIWMQIKSGAQDAVNGVIDKIDSLIRTINKIPGVKIPLIPKVNFDPLSSVRAAPGTAPKGYGRPGGPQSAYAIGTGYSPQGWALVGENGPELAYLPRGSQIKSNPTTTSLIGNGMADVISGAVANAMLQVMQSNKNQNVNGDIVLNLDGRTFARIVKPWLDKENKRVGANVRLQSI
jgi:tape measure domain-containing protein